MKWLDNGTFKGWVEATQFKKTGGDDTRMLLDGGGDKLISDLLPRDGSLPMTGNFNVNNSQIRSLTSNDVMVISNTSSTTNRIILRPFGDADSTKQLDLDSVSAKFVNYDVEGESFVNVNSDNNSMLLGGGGTKLLSDFVPKERKVSTGTGLSGGGDLSADRTLSFDTTWGDERYASSGHSHNYKSEFLSDGGTYYNAAITFDQLTIGLSGIVSAGQAGSPGTSGTTSWWYTETQNQYASGNDQLQFAYPFRTNNGVIHYRNKDSGGWKTWNEIITAEAAQTITGAKSFIDGLTIKSTKNGSWVDGEVKGVLNFYGSDVSGSGAGNHAWIKAVARDIYGVSTHMVFGVSNGGGEATESMRIDHNNNVNVVGDLTAPKVFSTLGGTSLRSEKKNIKAFKGSGLALIDTYKFYDFDYKDEKMGTGMFGIMLDEAPEKIKMDEKHLSLNNAMFVNSKGIQELSEIVKKQQKQINQLLKLLGDGKGD